MTRWTPRVAVCVPVHRDGARLDRLLTAIRATRWPADHLDVVVALDGPDPKLAAVAAAHGAEAVALSTRSGSYAARNCALDHLMDDVEVVVFTDADCIPRSGWLEAHVRALEEGHLSGGAVDVTVRPAASPAEFVDRVRHLNQQAYVTEQGYAATANLAVRREVAGLRFNGRLRSGGDAEFCRRATSLGYRLMYTPAAIVEHPARTTAWDVLRKVRRIGRGIEGRPEYWTHQPTPTVKVRRWLAHRARREGVSRGRLWEVRAIALDFLAGAWIARSVRRAKRHAGPPAHATLGYRR